MSATEPIDPVGSSDLDDYPKFELCCLVDDNAPESTITVFSDRDEEITTHWITMDADSAVALDTIR